MNNFLRHTISFCILFFSFSMSLLIAQPSNDEPGGALLLTINTGQNCSATTEVNLDGATQSEGEDCDNQDVTFPHDVWFKFTATEDSLLLAWSNYPVDTEIDIQITGPGYKVCDYFQYYGEVNPSDPQLLLENLVIGNEYFVRISPYDFPASYSFDLCLSDFQPLNVYDECSIAAVISENQSCFNGITLSNAKRSNQPSNCFNSNTGLNFDDDVWIRFKASKEAHIINIDVTGGNSNLIFEVLEGLCADPTSILCQDSPDTVFVVSNLVMGDDYFIRVASSNDLPQTTTFNICVEDYIPAQPPNDDCVDATTLVEGSCVPGNLTGSTDSNESYECGIDYSRADVWYSFTAEVSSYILEIDTISNAQTGDMLRYEVLKGDDCSNMIHLDCKSFTFDLALNDLEIGARYYVRVTSALGFTSTVSFEACLNSACSLMVSNTNSSGSGSLRSMIGCAESGAEIEFASSLDGQTINLATPAIIVDKTLNLMCESSRNITISNSSISNTNTLIDIQSSLNVTGLNLTGKSENSMILNVGSGGELKVLDTQLELISISKN